MTAPCKQRYRCGDVTVSWDISRLQPDQASIARPGRQTLQAQTATYRQHTRTLRDEQLRVWECGWLMTECWVAA